MTVLANNNDDRFDGDGAQVSFSFSFKLFNASDLLVYLIEDGVASLVDSSDYTVTINPVVDGGTVVFDTAPAADQEVYLLRQMDLTQETDVPVVGGLREEQIENELDKGVMIDQQLQEQIDRCIKQAVGSETDITLPAAEEGKHLGWDAGGNLVNLDPGEQGPQGEQGEPGDMTNPMTTQGDIIKGGASGVPERLGIGGANTVLHGGASSPAYSAVVEADITLADNTTNNVSTTKHGFVPKLPNDSTQFLNGVGAFATPATDGRLIDMQVFTSSGTWTKPSGCTKALVKVIGAGGGGGSGGKGCGGGGGGYAEKFITSGLGSTETVTVGAAGTGGASGGNPGASGGGSSFGSHCSANGGGGGQQNGAFGSGAAGGAGGTASGGDINLTGKNGQFPAFGNLDTGIGGDGGDSPMGFGFGGVYKDQSAQYPGQNYGGGGSGGNSAAGGNGTAGIVVVYSYR